MPKVASARSLRNRLTAVTRSLDWMLNWVMRKNAGSDPDHGDVGAVQRRDHAELSAAAELAREVRAGRERHRVVDVQDVEIVVLDHFDHLGREREVVGRLLEHRVVRRRGLVEEHVRLERAEPERQAVGDEVHLVAAARERQPSSVATTPLPPKCE